MGRTSVILFIAAVFCSSAVVSIPAPDIFARSIHWNCVDLLNEAMEDTVLRMYLLGHVITTAKKDNEIVGSQIEEKILANLGQFNIIFQQADARISDKSWTEDEARTLVGELSDTVRDLLKQLEGDLSKLSENAQEVIRNQHFDDLLWSINFVAIQIYAILRGDQSSWCGPQI